MIRDALNDRPPHGDKAIGHIVLVGLSGSGKSTVGRLLAVHLGRPFLDTDSLIVALAGRSIPELFATAGEAAFRAVERQAVGEALAGPPAVIATGGGAPVDATNREALWRGNFVVWLDAPVPMLAGRLGRSGAGRPLLADGVAERLTALSTARRHIYATANLRLDTSRRPAADVAAAILAAPELSLESERAPEPEQIHEQETRVR
ncbi:MAG: shikimate kinase [Chloroflexota bacterium]|nr:shikimate kinase [Chloroflexota bacterium]